MPEFLANKYHRWYDAIVAQGDDTADYVERHHILPKSLGGTNKKINLILLTARKHFLLHWLLTKFTTGQAFYKMQHAFGSMSNMKGKRCFASWQYELAARARQAALLNRWVNPEAHTIQSEKRAKWCAEHPDEMSAALLKRYEDPEAREVTGLAMKASYAANPEIQEKQSASHLKRYEDPKEHEKLSVAQNSRYESDAAREITSNAMVKYNAEHPENLVKFRGANKSWLEKSESRVVLSASSKKRWAIQRGEIPDDRTPAQIEKAKRGSERAKEKRRLGK